MKISVIVPSYKPQPYTWECLESLCNQTLEKNSYELIVVLNGCNEPYRSQIEDFIKHYPVNNWGFIQTNTTGVSNARNVGIEHAKGEYITFVDDDDYVSPSYLKSLLDSSSRDTIGFAHPSAFNSEGEISYILENKYNIVKNKGRIKYLNISKAFQGPCMKLFHREIIGNRRFNTSFKNGEDALFMFLLSDRFSYVCATSDDAIYHRRVRDNSATSSKKKMSYIVFNSLKLILQYSKIYWSHLGNYSISFYITRILGAFRMILAYSALAFESKRLRVDVLSENKKQGC